MAGWAPALAFFGLHVDLGSWHTQRQVWLRRPTARLTCPHGCEYVAVGAADVTHLTARTVPEHAQACPGLNLQKEDHV